MLTLKIDVDKSNTNELISYLDHVKQELQNGFTSGEGYDVTGLDDDESEE